MYQSFSINRPTLPNNNSKTRPIIKQENATNSSINLKKLSEDSVGSISEVSFLRIKRSNIIPLGKSPVLPSGKRKITIIRKNPENSGRASIKHIRVKKGLLML